MMKLKVLFLAIALVIVGQMAYADFLTCDPHPGATKYKVTIGPVEEISDANPDGSANHNIDAWAVGKHIGYYQAGTPYIINGVVQSTLRWSNQAPLDLDIPGLSAPSGTAIVP